MSDTEQEQGKGMHFFSFLTQPDDNEKKTTIKLSRDSGQSLHNGRQAERILHRSRQIVIKRNANKMTWPPGHLSHLPLSIKQLLASGLGL